MHRYTVMFRSAVLVRGANDVKYQMACQLFHGTNHWLAVSGVQTMTQRLRHLDLPTLAARTARVYLSRVNNIE